MDKKLLASRLHNTFKKQRDRLWTGYVYHMSTLYNISEEHFNRSQKSTDLQSKDDGSFLSYRHAPSYFAFKKHVEKSVSKQLEEEGKIREHYKTLNLNEEQKNTKTLLGLSWRYLARENFSFEPLEELFFPRNANDKTKAILMAEQTLGMNTRKLEGLKRLEEDLSKENYNDLLVIVYLERLKKEIKEDIIDKNVFITLILSLAGVVSAPVVFFIGVLFVIPAYVYQAPYFGKPEFFYDVLVWFIESLLTALSCLIFPIAMYHSYQTTGSMNILKGECARMIDTLLEEIEKEKNPNVVTDVTLSMK